VNSLPKPDSSIIDDDMSISDTADHVDYADEESATIFNEVDRPRHKHNDSSVSSTRVMNHLVKKNTPTENYERVKAMNRSPKIALIENYEDDEDEGNVHQAIADEEIGLDDDSEEEITVGEEEEEDNVVVSDRCLMDSARPS